MSKILTGLKIQDLIETYNNQNLSKDVYFGVHDLAYLQEKGFAHVFRPILADNGPIILKGTIEGIVLQLQESKRWEKKYGAAVRQYDLILAVPKWSRVVTVSTSEISPIEMITNIKQFDKLSLENYHLYEFFNKLHGVTGREVKINEQTDEERVNNLSDLVFLLRIIEDIKKISRCNNMRLFTIVPDINGRPRLAFSFATTCKIIDVRDVKVYDGTGIDPHTFKLVCSDSSGTLEIRLNSHIFNSSNELNRKFHNPRFGHPEELKGYNSSFLIIGNWFLGDDIPNVTLIIGLNPMMQYTKYEILGYLNTRKKVPFKDIKERWEGNREALSNWGNNYRIDKGELNCYYKEKLWSDDVFAVFIESGFQNPSFSKIMKLGIPFQKLEAWREYTSTYFKINDYMKMLYSSDDLVAKFESVYEELSTNIVKKVTQEEDEEEETLGMKQIPLLHEVNDWITLSAYAEKLKNSHYTVDDVFSWGNGGETMAKKWRRTRNSGQSSAGKTIAKKSQKGRSSRPVDELLSALAYISQGRGSVFLPE